MNTKQKGGYWVGRHGYMKGALQNKPKNKKEKQCGCGGHSHSKPLALPSHHERPQAFPYHFSNQSIQQYNTTSSKKKNNTILLTRSNNRPDTYEAHTSRECLKS